MHLLTTFFLSIYIVALISSMAAMEIFGWLSAFVGLFLYFKAKLSNSQVLLFPPLKYFIGVWIFWFSVIVGAFIVENPNVSALEIIGESRWVPLLVMLSLTLQTVSLTSQEKFYKYFL